MKDNKCDRRQFIGARVYEQALQAVLATRDRRALGVPKNNHAIKGGPFMHTSQAPIGPDLGAASTAFTASIAHEVNQPLSGILTNASTCVRMLDADPPNVDGARETAKRTIRDARRAAEVIERLRALFTKKGLSVELVDLNEATREVISLSRTELERNRVITRTELAEQLPLITGDRVQLQQVILNLLRNGSDAMNEVNDHPRELLFKTEVEEGKRVRLSVQDAGVGFEQQSLDRLFQTFFTTKEHGMGIGLSISRSIIENHGGRLRATPNDGTGVTFSFSLPCVLGGPERSFLEHWKNRFVD